MKIIATSTYGEAAPLDDISDFLLLTSRQL